MERIEDMWTIADVADYTGLARSSVRAYITMGDIPQPDINLGYKPLWRQDAVVEWWRARAHRV